MMTKELNLNKDTDLRNNPCSQNTIPSTRGSGYYHLWTAICIGLGTTFTKLARFLGYKTPYFSYEENKKTVTVDEESKTLKPKNIYNIHHAFVIITMQDGSIIITDPILVESIGPGYNVMIKFPNPSEQTFSDYFSERISEYARNNKQDTVYIVLSHFHRDHSNPDSIHSLINALDQKNIKVVFVVPKNAANYYHEFKEYKKNYPSFSVFDLNWANYIDINGNMLLAIPADHWSNRGIIDINQSSCNGYYVYDKKAKKHILFLGDTAHYTDNYLDFITEMIFTVQQDNDEDLLPNIIILNPVGPNFDRRWMKDTHQSVTESLLLMIRLAEKIKNKFYIPHMHQDVTTKEYLKNIFSVAIHHNSFCLGPDRYNESYFLFHRLLHLLDSEQSDDILAKLICREKKKDVIDKLFGRNYAWFYEDIIKLKEKFKILDINLKDYFEAHVSFPLPFQGFSYKEIFREEKPEFSLGPIYSNSILANEFLKDDPSAITSTHTWKVLLITKWFAVSYIFRILAGMSITIGLGMMVIGEFNSFFGTFLCTTAPFIQLPISTLLVYGGSLLTGLTIIFHCVHLYYTKLPLPNVNLSESKQELVTQAMESKVKNFRSIF